MKTILRSGGVLLAVFCLICCGSAAETAVAPQAMDPWNGIWETESYIMTIMQNGSVITGMYEPKEGVSVDPGVIEGTVSADGRTCSGTWTETGPVTYTLSDDAMAYTGIIGVSLNGTVIDPDIPATIGTRSLPSLDPQHIWAGTWNADRYTVNLVQDGTRVTGTYTPLSSVNDEPGTLEGSVSENGRLFTATWQEGGRISVTLAADGSFFNGTYTIQPDLDAASDSWNGIRIA